MTLRSFFEEQVGYANLVLGASLLTAAVSLSYIGARHGENKALKSAAICYVLGALPFLPERGKIRELENDSKTIN